MALLTAFGSPGGLSLPACGGALLLASLLGLAPRVAWACEPPRPGRVPVDRPITVFSDGSFLDASSDDEWSFLQGRPVRDVGGGRVSQVLEEDPNCDILQRLLFVDCTTGTAIIVHGVRQEAEWTEEGNLIAESALLLQPPHGPLALTASTTVAVVAGIATSEGWTVETDVSAFAAEHGRRNTFDPFMGCKIFYPGSVRAGG